MPTNFKAEVTNKKQLTANVLELDLRLLEPNNIEFKAGQFVQLKVSPKDKREYSFINGPKKSGGASFVITTAPMGPGSKYVLSLKVGDTVEFDGPYGVFIVRPEDLQRDQLLVATGTGIAPFMSIMSDLFENNFSKKITLLFGIRNESDAFYFDFFQDLAAKFRNFEFIPCLSAPAQAWPGFHGRVTGYLEQHAAEYAGRVVYICGGPPVIKDVRSLLISKGFGSKDIRLEIFT